MKVQKTRVPFSAEQNEWMLSMLPAGCDPERVVFWDIETTGFSRQYDSVYLMGYFYWEQHQPYIEQHLAASTTEEIELLELCLEKLGDFDVVISFNGDTFDVPFVKDRLQQMRVNGSFPSIQSWDLYKQYRPYASFFGWESCKLKSIERFLHLDRRDTMNGGELIEVFYEYSRTEDPQLEKTLLLHNYEDILNLPALLRIDAYVRYLQNCSVVDIQVKQEAEAQLSLSFLMSKASPLALKTCFYAQKKSVPIQLRTDYQESTLCLTIPLCQDTLRYYLPNYKEYYILPSGNLLHKSLDTPPQKKTATRAECYLPKEGTFLPIPKPTAWQGLHPFQYNYKDKQVYYDCEELNSWLPQRTEEERRLFLNQFLPFSKTQSKSEDKRHAR